MFNDSDAEDRVCISISSNWKQEKKLVENDCQTDKTKNVDQESQVKPILFILKC